MFLHSHLILAIEDPVKWKYNTQLYREKQKVECGHIWNIVCVKYMVISLLRLWPLSSVREHRLLLCYALVLFALNYREDEVRKEISVTLVTQKQTWYMSVLSLSEPWNRVKKLLNFFPEYWLKSSLFSNNCLNISSKMNKFNFSILRKISSFQVDCSMYLRSLISS